MFRPHKRKVPTVPIIPLIDILAILLIYFAVEYDPKVEREVLDIHLASANQKATVSTDRSTAVISLAKDGTLRLDATQVHPHLLVEYLRVFREKYPERALEIVPDKEVALQRFIALQNALLKAGIDPATVPSRVRID